MVVQAPDGYSFRGLIVQAYDPGNNQPIGSFSSGRGLKTIDACSAVTHTDRRGEQISDFFLTTLFQSLWTNFEQLWFRQSFRNHPSLTSFTNPPLSSRRQKIGHTDLGFARRRDTGWTSRIQGDHCAAFQRFLRRLGGDSGFKSLRMQINRIREANLGQKSSLRAALWQLGRTTAWADPA